MSDEQKKFELGDREPRYIYDPEQNALRAVRTEEEYRDGKPAPEDSNTKPTNPQETPVPESERDDGRKDHSVPSKQQPVGDGGKVTGPALNKDSRTPLSPNPPAAGEKPNPNTSPGLVSTGDKK